jgi:hypothetical protein
MTQDMHTIVLHLCSSCRPLHSTLNGLFSERPSIMLIQHAWTSQVYSGKWLGDSPSVTSLKRGWQAFQHCDDRCGLKSAKRLHKALHIYGPKLIQGHEARRAPESGIGGATGTRGRRSSSVR